MSAALPLYAATAEEPIPAADTRDVFNVPDMRLVTPIETMLADLAHAPTNEDFVAALYVFVREIGCTLMAHRDRDGGLALNAGYPCDQRSRHRNRWMHFLIGALNRREGCRALLLRYLETQGLRWDERPAVIAEVKSALRWYLRTGGRVMIDPSGKLVEGCGLSRTDWTTPAVFEAAQRAARKYFEQLGRPGASRFIRRAARICGTPARNGWIVLERMAA